MRASEVNRFFFAWVDESRRAGRPFFATLNYMDVHDPYWPPEPFTHKYHNGITRRGLLALHNGSHPRANTSEDGRQLVIAAYDACIAYLDHQWGELLNELARRGLLENTIVIITADHGEALGEEKRWGHSAPYLTQEVTRIPLIVRYPTAVPQGVRVSHPVSHAQIPATVLQLLGVASDAHSQMLPSLLVSSQEPVLINGGVRHAIAFEKWHYITEKDTKRNRLYDLDADPRAEHNLSGQPAFAHIEAHMRHLLEAMIVRHHIRPPTQAEAVPDR
jgi:arylsulfatase A-like enzyme